MERWASFHTRMNHSLSISVCNRGWKQILGLWRVFGQSSIIQSVFRVWQSDTWVCSAEMKQWDKSRKRLSGCRPREGGGVYFLAREGDYCPLLTFSALLPLWRLTGLTKHLPRLRVSPASHGCPPWPDRHSWPTGGPPHGYLYTTPKNNLTKSGNPTANTAVRLRGDARDFSQLKGAHHRGNQEWRKHCRGTQAADSHQIPNLINCESWSLLREPCE